MISKQCFEEIKVLQNDFLDQRLKHQNEPQFIPRDVKIKIK